MGAALLGIGGAIGSLLIVGAWTGAAMLFGFPPPTPDQTMGLFWMLGCGGLILGAILGAVFS